jgi:hypothetical protein
MYWQPSCRHEPSSRVALGGLTITGPGQATTRRGSVKLFLQSPGEANGRAPNRADLVKRRHGLTRRLAGLATGLAGQLLRSSPAGAEGRAVGVAGSSGSSPPAAAGRRGRTNRTPTRACGGSWQAGKRPPRRVGVGRGALSSGAWLAEWSHKHLFGAAPAASNKCPKAVAESGLVWACAILPRPRLLLAAPRSAEPVSTGSVSTVQPSPRTGADAEAPTVAAASSPRAARPVARRQLVNDRSREG